MPSWKIIQGNCLEVLRQLPAGSVQTTVCSPPYFGLRSYETEPAIWAGRSDCNHSWGDEEAGSTRGGSGTPTGRNNRGENYGRAAARGQFCTKCPAWRGELGLEPEPGLFVEHLVAVFREVRRVLRDDGTLWVNLGDSYSPDHAQSRSGDATENVGFRAGIAGSRARDTSGPPPGCKPKDLIGTPWMFAFAMRADGWYLRADIIWSKMNGLPEAVRDRPTRAHEYVFLFSKSERYFYDREAITEKSGANARSVWSLNAEPFAGAHFASYPPELPRRCVLAGTSEHGACIECGTPWRRIVVHPCEACGADVRLHSQTCEACGHVRDWKAEREATPELLSTEWSGGGREVPRRKKNTTKNKAVGWEQTCACATDAVRPCLVLDVFNGTATTGEVSVQSGRDYIGIELNPEYIELSKARLTGASREDLREGGFIFCPTCEKNGVVKMFERAAVEKSRAEGRKLTCPKCLGRFTAAELGVVS